MTTKEALELASTVELYDALFKRFDAYVFMGSQHRPTEDNPLNTQRLWHFKGDPFVCLGYVSNLAHRFNQEILGREHNVSVDEL